MLEAMNLRDMMALIIKLSSMQSVYMKITTGSDLEMANLSNQRQESFAW